MDVADFSALQAARVAQEPFAHILLPRFIRAEALPAVIADLPAMKGRGSFPIEALRLGAAAQAVVAALRGDQFRAIVEQKFGLDLAASPQMLTLRGNSGPKDGQIHTDSIAKRVTILLYLNPGEENWARQEGCLRLLRGPDNLDDYAAEIPPVDGTLLIFPNGPASWHGHRPYTGQRYVMQMNFMTTSTKAKAEMRRHHVSAFIKRMTRAA
jgi:hypothetical protein